MKVSPQQLANTQTAVYYLFGEDEDAMHEAAASLLGSDDTQSTLMRLDIEELSRFTAAVRSPSLFGPSQYRAIIRNAGSATPAQAKALLDKIDDIAKPHRLILCATGEMYKKAWHKKLCAHRAVACCEFQHLSEAGFQQWFAHSIEAAGLAVAADDIATIAAQLHGLRMEAKQLIARMQCYDNGEGQPIPLAVMRDLCGEHSPESLDEWCHATAMRQPQAVFMAHQLLTQQQVSEVQMQVWLSTRFQQLLLYAWHHAKNHPNPAQQARLFGAARKQVPEEARVWDGNSLVQVMHDLGEAEQAIKGGSPLPGAMIMEQLTAKICRQVNP
jgi:DNA polymerase III delta subunit